MKRNCIFINMQNKKTHIDPEWAIDQILELGDLSIIDNIASFDIPMVVNQLIRQVGDEDLPQLIKRATPHDINFGSIINHCETVYIIIDHFKLETHELLMLFKHGKCLAAAREMGYL